MSAKAAAVAMVKDECDIIELFVKINSRVVDHLFVIDHCSKDGTLEILMRLKAGGYPLSIFRDESQDFQQPLMITSLLRQVAATNEYDYIITLDGDEFIHCDPAQGRFADVLAREIPPGHCGQIAWTTYVPTGGDYYASDAPLHEVFRKRTREPAQFYKVIVPNEQGKHCVVTEGNHHAAIDGQLLPAVIVSPVLQHVPVRSVEQITAKALIGSRRLSIKVGRGKTVGMHWEQMADKIRRSNYRLTHADMMAMAFLYLDNPDAAEHDTAIDESAPPVGGPGDRIELRELSRINLVKKFDEFIAALCAEIRPARGIPADQ